MRRQQHIGSEVLIALEGHLDGEDVAVRIGRHPQRQLEALVPVGDLHRRHARRQQLEGIVLQPLDLDPEPFAVGDDEAEVANLRDVDPRVIDLVDDPEAQGEPHPGRADGAADHVLGAAGPGRRDPGMARRRRGFRARPSLFRLADVEPVHTTAPLRLPNLGRRPQVSVRKHRLDRLPVDRRSVCGRPTRQAFGR